MTGVCDGGSRMPSGPSRENAKRYSAVAQTEALVRARVSVDQISTFKARHAECDRAQPRFPF